MSEGWLVDIVGQGFDAGVQAAPAQWQTLSLGVLEEEQRGRSGRSRHADPGRQRPTGRGRRGGEGIAYLPEHFAEPFLGDGRLCTVLEDWCPPIDGLALYSPLNRHMPSALLAFVDTLRAVKPEM
ncbi:LysR substrate-binding domain-containing protein [Oceanicella sp. SM1341]|uniref:LysR substrate-binding domain-containing protein n=1 Tax=Oceanicella sp. SM1341 TaxID=1548889 RepID=UPI0018E5108D|nr:LysR substrate-binding domain-containing protein [Oceanicella sp. SM1341]